MSDRASHFTGLVTIAEIQRAVADHFRIPLIEMTSQRRGRGVARARQVAMLLAADLTPFSLEVIGRHFGGRDRTTVAYALRVVPGLAAADPSIAEAITVLHRRFVDPDQLPLLLAAE